LPKWDTGRRRVDKLKRIGRQPAETITYQDDVPTMLMLTEDESET
jgi:hypothetical protein